MAFTTSFSGPSQTSQQAFNPNGTPMLPQLNFPMGLGATSMTPSPLPGGINLTGGINMNNYLSPIQSEIGNTQTEAGNLYSGLAGNFNSQQQQLQGDLMNQLNAGLTSSVPGIEDRLQNLGLLQSGAYPDALAQQKGQILSNTILPTLTNFDLGAFNQLNAIPQQAYNTVQGLQQGSIGRQFSQQDIANQQQFQQGLANQMQQTQQLQALLGLAPALIGSGGLPGLLGSMNGGSGAAGGVPGGTAGSGLGSIFGPNASGGLGLGSILASGGLGAGGSALGNALGLGGAGAGALAGLGGMLGGGGLLGGLGAGLGSAFGGTLGAGIGGAAGNFLSNDALPYLADYFTS